MSHDTSRSRYIVHILEKLHTMGLLMRSNCDKLDAFYSALLADKNTLIA